MTIVDLKHEIETRTIDNSFRIFVLSDNSFLANQYINAICEILQLERTSVESIFAKQSALSLIMGFDNNLQVLHTEVFDEVAEDYSIFTNTVVVCNKVDKKIEPLVKEYVTNFPKLEEWQIKAYMQRIYPELSESDLDWLYKGVNGDIYQLELELAKFELFTHSERAELIANCKIDSSTDLYTIDTFTLSDAIIKQDFATVREYLKHRRFCKIELFALINAMLKKVKNILFIQYNSGKTAKELEISDKYYSRLRSNKTEQVDLPRLQVLLAVLSAIDLQVKSGELDLSTEAQIDYVLMRLML